MTVLEVIQHATDFLTRKGVESPRLQSELLLAHVLRRPRMRLYLEFQREVPEPQLTQCRAAVKRRGAREPLQHILGTVSFAGIELGCGPQAFIPRPETELLAEHAVTWLKQCPHASPVVLDMGTGTGCLAIAVAIGVPGAVIQAADISPDALQLAMANAARHGLESRITFHLTNGFVGLPAETRFDLILSNPPYIPAAEVEMLQPEVRDHDPRAALDGGPDGLDIYRMLGREAADWLRPGGAILVEHGAGQAAAITRLWTGEKWVVEPPLADYSGRERFLIARRSSLIPQMDADGRR